MKVLAALIAASLFVGCKGYEETVTKRNFGEGNVKGEPDPNAPVSTPMPTPTPVVTPGGVPNNTGGTSPEPDVGTGTGPQTPVPISNDEKPFPLSRCRLPQSLAEYDKLPNPDVLSLYASGTTLIVATQQGLSISRNTGDTWKSPCDSNFDFSTVTEVYGYGDTVVVLSDLKLAVSKDLGKTWSIIPLPKLEEKLLNLYVNRDGVYAVSDKGVFYSKDFGLNWLAPLKTSKLSGNHEKVYIVENNSFVSAVDGKIWANPYLEPVKDAVAVGTTVYLSTPVGLVISSDGGGNWKTKTTRDGLFTNAAERIRMIDSAIFLTYDSSIAYSIDGGAKWKYRTFDMPAIVKVYSVFSSGQNIFVGSAQGIQVSKDFGETWTVIQSASPKYMQGPDFGITPLKTIFTSNLVSKDLGLSWKAITTANGFPLNARKTCVSGKFVYIMDAFTLSVSEDEGVTWVTRVKEKDLDEKGLTDKIICDGKRVLVRTFGGTALSRDAGVTWKKRTTAEAVDLAAWNVMGFGESEIYRGSRLAIHVSKDEGLTWKVIYQTDDYPGASLAVSGFYTKGTTLYVATNEGLLSTVDQVNWAKPKDPFDVGKVFFIGSYIYAQSQRNQIVASIDGGLTWKKVFGRESIDKKHTRLGVAANTQITVRDPIFGLASAGESLFAMNTYGMVVVNPDFAVNK